MHPFTSAPRSFTEAVPLRSHTACVASAQHPTILADNWQVRSASRRARRRRQRRRERQLLTAFGTLVVLLAIGVLGSAREPLIGQAKGLGGDETSLLVPIGFATANDTDSPPIDGRVVDDATPVPPCTETAASSD